MDQFITLRSFSLPTEAHIAKTLLESEGVDVFLKDELTVQSNHLFSPAVGGVKLQVLEFEVDRAIEILRDNGIMSDKSETEADSAFDLWTQRLPVIGSYHRDIRRFSIIGIATAIVSIVLAYLFYFVN